MFDLLFKNAKVVDGTGTPWYVADVAVHAGKIAKIGKISESAAKKVINAEGNVLSPGFIDTHSHSDYGILRHKYNESRILQGVTTELVGDCGSSPFPISPKRIEEIEKTIEMKVDWADAKGYLGKVEQNGTSVNFATLAGHGTIRGFVMGYEDKAPTPDELEKMRKIAAECMDAGCFGLSSGFIYTPGCFATNEEVIEIAKVVSEYGGLYKTHMRHEGDKVMQSVEDSIELGRVAKLPVQIDHHKVTGRKNWKYKAHATVANIKRARESGIDVTVDQYPYRASATSLNTTLSQWVLEGGTPEMLKRLKDPGLRPKIIEEMRKSFAWNQKIWSDVFITSVPGEKNAWVKGKNILEIAEKLGKDPFDAAVDLLIEEEGRVSQLSFGMCEEDIELIMQQPFTMIGSDGGCASLETKDFLHPRTFGTFPRVIAEYARNRKLISLETAIHKMTGFPAARMGLSDRGLIKVGMCADLVLFDYEKINDTPSFTKSNVPCEGIIQVYVNGVLTAENGVHTKQTAGKVLRKA